MKRFVVFSLLAWVIMTSGLSNAQAQWSRLRIARGWDQGYGVAIGKGRNDDTVRVYFAGDSSGGTTWPVMYEYTYMGGAWVKTSSYVDYVGYLTVADARNDSVQRVYSVGYGSNKEFEYVGSIWVRDTILRNGSNWGLACGMGRNDGKRRLYLSGYSDGHMYEYEYVVDHWVMRDMGASGGAYLKGVALGQGRNDSLVRVYATHLNGHVYEYTDSSGVWQVVDMGTIVLGVLSNGGIAIGDGRNDGVQRIYVSIDTLGPGGKGIIAEYSYEGGNWVISWVGNNELWFWPVAVGQGRNDTVNRVYAASVDNHVYEFTYNGSQWIKAEVGVGETRIYWMRDLTVGLGRGDDVNRVYAVNDADLFEFTWNGNGVETDKESTDFVAIGEIRVRPNPFRKKTNIEYYLREGGGVNVRFYNCLGRVVRRATEGVQPVGWRRIEWDGRDSEGQILPAGVYFCRLSVGKGLSWESKTIKLIWNK